MSKMEKDKWKLEKDQEWQKIFDLLPITHVFDIVAVTTSVPVCCLAILMENSHHNVKFTIYLTQFWFTSSNRRWLIFVWWCFYRVQPGVWGWHQSISTTHLRYISGLHFFQKICATTLFYVFLDWNKTWACETRMGWLVSIVLPGDEWGEVSTIGISARLKFTDKLLFPW